MTRPPVPNQTYRFTWDGKDAYGRDLQGQQVATIRIGYVYERVFGVPAAVPRSFGLSAPGAALNAARIETTLWHDQRALLGVVDDRPFGFGGWTLDVQRGDAEMGTGLRSLADCRGGMAGLSRIEGNEREILSST